jgi:hypothetical protein
MLNKISSHALKNRQHGLEIWIMSVQEFGDNLNTSRKAPLQTALDMSMFAVPILLPPTPEPEMLTKPSLQTADLTQSKCLSQDETAEKNSFSLCF